MKRLRRSMLRLADLMQRYQCSFGGKASPPPYALALVVSSSYEQNTRIR